jgi:hypothetical protein
MLKRALVFTFQLKSQVDLSPVIRIVFPSLARGEEWMSLIYINVKMGQKGVE